VEGKGISMDLCSDKDERQAQPSREEYGSRWGRGVVNLARDPSSESRASSKFSSSSGCEAAAELIREFTDRLRSTLRSDRGLQTARKDQQQPMIRPGQWQPPSAESLPHARCGIRNPVAAGERMAGEQPRPAAAHTSVPDASSGIHHRSWGTGGAEGEGAGRRHCHSCDNPFSMAFHETQTLIFPDSTCPYQLPFDLLSLSGRPTCPLPDSQD